MSYRKTGSYLFAFLAILAIYAVNTVLSVRIPAPDLLLTRSLLFAFCGAGVIVFKISNQPNARRLSYILMSVNLAFFIVSFFTVKFWGLDLQSARGIALAKLSDSLIISVLLIVLLFLAGYKTEDLFLRGGRLFRGLFIGFFFFVVMGFLAINNPDQPIKGEFLKNNLEWVLIFVFSNAFMEELLFRGILLKPLQKFMKPYMAVILTSVVFATAHLQADYSSHVLLLAASSLILGMAWGFLMNYTRSMIASVLFHAGADLMIILSVYHSFGAK